MAQSLPPALQLVKLKKDAEAIFAKHGLSLPFDASRLVVTTKNIYEPTSCTAISDALLNSIFPPIGSMELLHFTKPDVLPSILQNKEFWLATVTKNFDAGEYLSFIREHGYASASSKPIRRQLAGNFFYASFTSPGSSSTATHWNDFASAGRGYCLRFLITPKRAELRRIRYQGGQKSELARLDDDLRASINRTFFPRGVARLTAFSLVQNLAYEDEIRLLVSNPPDTMKFKVGTDDYIALGLGNTDPWCEIKLLGVTCGQAANESVVQSLARRHGFTNLIIDTRKTQ